MDDMYGIIEQDVAVLEEAIKNHRRRKGEPIHPAVESFISKAEGFIVEYRKMQEIEKLIS